MSFAKFFKDALLPVAVWTCGVLLSCFVLTVAGASASIVVVAVGVSFIFGMLGIVIEYARRRRFLRQLERAAEELESPGIAKSRSLLRILCLHTVHFEV